MKILCATDFTPRARAAAKVAIALAQRTAGSVELVHVVVEPNADLQASMFVGGAAGQEIREGLNLKLVMEAQELAGGSEVALTHHLGEGDPVASLLARAKRIDADLIVLGAQGRSAMERFILGSTAERMVRRADRPVLIVPPGVEGLGLAEDRQRPLRVMTALDGRATSDGGVRFAGRLRAETACDVTFLRLYWPVEEYARLGLTRERHLAGPDPEVVADLERTLRTQVGVLPGTGEIVYAVEPAWGEPASQLFVAANEHDAELIVMGAESRHGWARLLHPPVTSRVAAHAFGLPVVFVPAPPPDESRRQVPGIFTVLAPTDLSASGNRAVPFAYAMVSARGGVVELCHVHERSLPNPPTAYDRPEDTLGSAERARVESALRGLVPAEAARLGITTHVTVIDGGKAAEAITQAAERLVVDAIVLGSHGRSGAIRSLLGSVSQAVVRQARHPVLVVPSGPVHDSSDAGGHGASVGGA
jgi:nucleotide-binding universal stress UspA family protein